MSDFQFTILKKISLCQFYFLNSVHMCLNYMKRRDPLKNLDQLARNKHVDMAMGNERHWVGE